MALGWLWGAYRLAINTLCGGFDVALMWPFWFQHFSFCHDVALGGFPQCGPYFCFLLSALCFSNSLALGGFAFAGFLEGNNPIGGQLFRPLLSNSCTLHCRRVTPIAFCISGEGQIRLQNACADSAWSFPRLIRLAPQVITGRALVEFSTAVVSR